MNQSTPDSTGVVTVGSTCFALFLFFVTKPTMTPQIIEFSNMQMAYVVIARAKPSDREGRTGCKIGNRGSVRIKVNTIFGVYKNDIDGVYRIANRIIVTMKLLVPTVSPNFIFIFILFLL